MTTLLTFIVALALMILLHELGHFIVARLVGIPIEEFGIGFPPRLFTLFEAGGTRYTINLIPLGGFVRPKVLNDGSDGGDVVDALAVAPPGKQILVAFAGPVMNLLIAVILYALIFAHTGVPQTDKVLIVNVAPDSPAAAAGLQPGDIIVAINGAETNTMEAIHEQIYNHLGEPITMTVLRENKPVTVTLTPRTPPPSTGAIGILMSYPVVRVGLPAAAWWGVRATWGDIVRIAMLPAQLISHPNNPDMQLLGYKGMYQTYEQFRSADVQAAQQNPNDAFPVNTLVFFIMVTVSLGVFNLLPVPALDGGRITVSFVELVSRRRLPVRAVNIINMAGFLLLLGVLLLVNLREWLP